MLTRRSSLRALAGFGLVGLGQSGWCAAPNATLRDVLAHHAELVHASYADAVAQAKLLKAAIDAFVAAPTEPGLTAARRAWLDAREWYGQTEAFRFYGGPIDGKGGPEPRINAWPIDESYVDYVEGRPSSGIINDRRIPLGKARLAALNELRSEANISTGWHAIEFLLWGQDFDPKGPGRRPASDYVDGQRPNADRRRAYLRLVAELLIDDLSAVLKAWVPGVPGNYRVKFVARAESLGLVFTGLGALSRAELAGERLEVALDTQQQEDEHSCFSDNTHRDFVAALVGIGNVWRGEFRRVDGSVLKGPSPRGLVVAKAGAAAADVDAKFDAAMQAALALQPPFDQEIIGADTAPGRVRAFALLRSLRALADALAQASTSLGLRGLVSASRARR